MLRTARILVAALVVGACSALVPQQPAVAAPTVVFVQSSSQSGVDVQVTAGTHTIVVTGSYLYATAGLNPSAPTALGWLASADAECSTPYNPWNPTDLEPHRFGTGFGDLLDLRIDGADVEWTPVAPNPAAPGCALAAGFMGLHGYVYTTTVSASSDGTINLRVSDPGFTGDNVGMFEVLVV